MECPHCKLINPPTAQRCDCGYDFPSGQIKESYLPNRERKVKASGIVWKSSLIFSIFRVFILLDKNQFHSLDLILVIALLALLISLFYWAKHRSIPN